LEKSNETNYFVEIQNPEHTERSILESLKLVLEGLERFENFKEERKAKVEKTLELRKRVREINRLISSLKECFPDTKLELPKMVKAVPKHAVKAHAQKKVIAPAAVSKVPPQPMQETPVHKEPRPDLKRLEAELNEIEQKLESLR
jgi:hypothetical protein